MPVPRAEGALPEYPIPREGLRECLVGEFAASKVWIIARAGCFLKAPQALMVVCWVDR